MRASPASCHRHALTARVALQKKWGWECRYVQQYNAIGEAPDEVRQCFQQRSRWCKGHFQTFWSSQCPLVDTRLGPFYQLCYSSTCLSYISAGARAPLPPSLHLMLYIFATRRSFVTALHAPVAIQQLVRC